MIFYESTDRNKKKGNHPNKTEFKTLDNKKKNMILPTVRIRFLLFIM